MEEEKREEEEEEEEDQVGNRMEEGGDAPHTTVMCSSRMGGSRVAVGRAQVQVFHFVIINL